MENTVMMHPQPVDMAQHVESRIFHVRGMQVMLGTHLAEMYEVEPGVLERAVERNPGCFPEDSVLRLSMEELAGLGIPEDAVPYAFTGPAMIVLASILLDENAAPMRDTCAPTCGCHG